MQDSDPGYGPQLSQTAPGTGRDRVRFAPNRPVPPGLWRRTPPAIFPPIMGLFGLGLGWRAAEAHFMLSLGLGDLILGAATALYLFALIAYLAKPARRLSVLLDEVRVLPGRAGLAAMCLSMILMAIALHPLAPALAQGIAALALGLHMALVGTLLVLMAVGRSDLRQITPVYHLTFVGFIITAYGAVTMGHGWFAQLIWWGLLPVVLPIWAVGFWQFLRGTVPPPLRPLWAIHLAPASIFAIVASGLGYQVGALIFLGIGGVVLVALLIRWRWITQAGFSPMWGAFTFPVAAYAAACLTVSSGQGVLGVLALVVLGAASIVVPVIAFRIFRLWAGGMLAERSNAAIA